MTRASDLERNKALIRAHYESTTNNYDPAQIERQVAEDFHDHTLGVKLGPAGVKRHIEAILRAFPDLHVSIDDMVAEGDRVAVRATWQGTHLGEFQTLQPTERHVSFSGMVLWRIVDDKIADRWAYIDTGTLFRQLTQGEEAYTGG